MARRMLSPSEFPKHNSNNPVRHLLDTIFSYDGNVMLAALVSLLLVILFVLLLHIYAKWFLAQAHHRRRSSMTVSQRVLGPNRFHHFHTFTFDPTHLSSPSAKGLDPSTISTIPLFAYNSDDQTHKQLECVICLSPFEDNDVGRTLPKCAHCFHVDCIDMWLGSHMSCPICRAPVLAANTDSSTTLDRVVGHEQLGNGDSANGETVIDVLESGDVDHQNQGVGSDSLSASESSTSSSSSPLMLGCSLKRMLSRNRPENKVFPSTNGNNMEA